MAMPFERAGGSVQEEEPLSPSDIALEALKVLMDDEEGDLDDPRYLVTVQEFDPRNTNDLDRLNTHLGLSTDDGGALATADYFRDATDAAKSVQHYVECIEAVLERNSEKNKRWALVYRSLAIACGYSSDDPGEIEESFPSHIKIDNFGTDKELEQLQRELTKRGFRGESVIAESFDALTGGIRVYELVDCIVSALEADQAEDES